MLSCVQIIASVQAIVSFFSVSDKAVLRLEADGTHKIEKFSSTRFAVTTWVFISVLNAFDRICDLVGKDEITIDSNVWIKAIFPLRYLY